MAVVVSDTSAIRAFYHLNQLELLHQLFGDVVIPPAVLTELATPVGRFQPILLRDLGAIRVVMVRDRQSVASLQEKLDPGESEAISLAIEMSAELLLIDERPGRFIARQ